jgi:hypothetical protein
MSDQDVINRLLKLHDHIEAPVTPVSEDVARGERLVWRRRAGAGVAAVAAVVLGVALVQATQFGGSPSPQPAHDPSPSPSPSLSSSLDPGAAVGSKLRPPLAARAPQSWDVMADDEHMTWLVSDQGAVEVPKTGCCDVLRWEGEQAIYFVGPIVDLIDPQSGAAVSLPADGYAAWLREHPLLTVVDETTVTIDGQQFPQLTIVANDDSGSVYLDNQGGNEETPLYSELPDQAVLIETVIEMDGRTMVVRAVSSKAPDQRNELSAALNLVLSTMDLPN